MRKSAFCICKNKDADQLRSNHAVDQGLYYTPGIYADGYIVFAFPFVRSSIRMFVCSFVIPSRSWNLRPSFALKFLK